MATQAWVSTSFAIGTVAVAHEDVAWLDSRDPTARVEDISFW
jgi:type IV secretory pathway TrbD component